MLKEKAKAERIFKKKNIACILSILLVLTMLPYVQAAVSPAQQAGDLLVYRIAPETAFLGEEAWIALIFENPTGAEKTVMIKESLGDAEFDTSEAKYVETEYGEKFWYYQWTINLAPKNNATVAYWITPNEPGTYVISPAEIYMDNNRFTLKAFEIQIRCNMDGSCRSGENSLNCPEDCPTGSSDKICDPVADAKCDPDCEQTADPDCLSGGQPGGDQNMLMIGGIVLIVITAAAVVYWFFLRK